jgi:rhamnopyranosyl-N-acetylglucosaminyl-diphospho-decaprenol beta-1,3/1,4-galactofuranosyltransferase
VPRVVATVLTRNRAELLRQALAAVLAQDHPVERVIVVDNASTDGTLAMLAEEFPDVTVMALAENTGSAGGFYEAIAAGLRAGADWLWLLDDDAVARPTALAELVAALDRLNGPSPPALLCSRVEWRDGTQHLMNRPVTRRRGDRELVAAMTDGVLPVRAATWVSLLLSREAVERAGMPLRHFFYQADDIEYTARILLDAAGYYVPRSVVEHRTPAQHTAIDDDRRFHHHIRNTVLMIRGRAWTAREKLGLVKAIVATSLTYLRINRLRPRSVGNVIRAMISGVRSPLG